MHDVFISYSTLDSNTALNIRKVLENDGVVCWMAPRDIPSGSNYTREIPQAIRNCKIFLLVLSKNAQSSQWVLRELDSAVNQRRYLLPVMIDEEPLRDEFDFLLTGAQRHPACPAGIDALRALSERVKEILLPKEVAEEKAAERTVSSSGRIEQKRDPAPPEQKRLLLCPHCGTGIGMQFHGAKMLKGLYRVTAEEKLTLWLIPVFGGLFFFLSALIVSILTVLANISLAGAFLEILRPFILVACVLLGCWTGERLSRKIVLQKRQKLGWNVRSFRCERCGTKFHVELNQCGIIRKNAKGS
ncbi:MAG: toll/interleukin-1 receptor domain-containing protein [Oscillospiraceae bacterium]|nr:toll/interleukin-1 receptor domain-containing protein [Oscillospiraceae bacterium]